MTQLHTSIGKYLNKNIHVFRPGDDPAGQK
jgi:hypothetical protein